MKLNNRAYDALKFIALVVLPGFSAAYFTLAQVWGLPNAEQVVGTATVLDTLLGLILKNSSTHYDPPPANNSQTSDGDLLAVTDEDGDTYLSLAINKENLDSLAIKEQVTLQVVRHSPSSNTE